jgi:hypothetical protein
MTGNDVLDFVWNLPRQHSFVIVIFHLNNNEEITLHISGNSFYDNQLLNTSNI